MAMEEFQVRGIHFRGNIILEAKILRPRHQDLNWNTWRSESCASQREGYLYVNGSWSIVADSLIERITSRQLRRNLSDRDSSHQITTEDWQSWQKRRYKSETVTLRKKYLMRTSQLWNELADWFRQNRSLPQLALAPTRLAGSVMAPQLLCF